MLHKAIVAAAVVLCASAGSALAGGWNVGVSIGLPLVPVQPYYAPPSAYVFDEPAPVYAPPYWGNRYRGDWRGHGYGHGYGHGRRWRDDDRRYDQPPSRVVYREERVERFDPRNNWQDPDRGDNNRHGGRRGDW